MSDINGTVVAIQGEAISATAPTDGYVLTWDDGDGYWLPKPVASSGLTRIDFTSDGYWTCPDNITTILAIGAGGGGGAGGGACAFSNVDGPQSGGGAGGGGSLETMKVLVVSPGTTYAILIGAGGTGGAGGAATPTDGNVGSPGISGGLTQIKQGTTILVNFFGGCAGGGAGDRNGAFSGSAVGWGGTSCSLDTIGNLRSDYRWEDANPGSFITVGPGFGGSSTRNTGGASFGGSRSIDNLYAGGAGGTHHSSNYIGSGGGGGAGPKGNGAVGGAGETLVSNAPSGSSASANTGAGGGGGGGANYNFAGGAGGNGGSGYLTILF